MQEDSVVLVHECPACEEDSAIQRGRLICPNGHVFSRIAEDHAVDEARRFLRGLARRGAPNPRLVNPCDGRGWLYWACIRIAHSDPVRARRIALKMTTGAEKAMRWCWEHERGMRAGGGFDEMASLHCRWMWALNSGVWLAERGHPLVGEDEGAGIWRVAQ